MAETTNISWTDATFNPWWGCTKIAPGCDNCYAAAFDKRTGGDHWNGHIRTLSDNNWKMPPRLNRKAIKEGRRYRVFCGSMCDVFDADAPQDQRERLWQMIRDTPELDWQLLTKRAPNIKKYLPDDWGDGYPNVWLGVTVEDKKHGFPRIDHLRRIPAKIRFLSCEPLLEDITRALPLGYFNTDIDWIICGGESGPGAREMKIEWALNLKWFAQFYKIPFFFKQWGGTGRNKGGCLMGGKIIKEFPVK